MQKRLLYRISLTAIILVAVSFGKVSFAAEVTRVNTNKGHIYIDEGKDAGFIMGAEVCFYSSSGEEIVCGKVRRATDSYAMVEVNNRKAKGIENGMPAALADHKAEKEEGDKGKLK
jgi:ribosomal protein L35AE/L33A